MPEDCDKVVDIVRRLASYVDANPLACDAAPGIARWWLQAEFEQAVRQALRDLSRPAALGRNPLVRTRLVHSRLTATRTGAHVLEALLRDAVDTLTEDPRDDRLLRAVDRTFVRPAATQESAAAMLRVPFSSYRRHLSQGIARIVSWLWEQELHGDPIRD